MKRFPSLKKNSEFQTVYRTGKSYANKYLVMYAVNTGSDRTRIGISVSKKVGNSVVRHHFVRLVREAFRLNGDILKSGYDIIVVARAAAKDKNASGRSQAHDPGMRHALPRRLSPGRCVF